MVGCRSGSLVATDATSPTGTVSNHWYDDDVLSFLFNVAMVAVMYDYSN
jgi:hypothetical protein